VVSHEMELQGLRFQRTPFGREAIVGFVGI
jgi:hypothetical protein